MSNSVSDESAPTRAFGELEELVRHLADELAGFRRRAFAAEARVRELEAAAGTGQGEAAAGTPAAENGPATLDSTVVARGAPELGTAERVAELERENQELRQRLEAAAARTRTVLDRVRFLRQQQNLGGGDR